MSELEDVKIQWHPAFVAAMMLELQDNREQLFFDDEHRLSSKPLEFDLLVIKKEPGVKLKSKLGEIFKDYNVMEYKSPHDELNIDNFHKALAYAHLFKSENDGKVNKYPSESITVSMVRHAFPREMFKELEAIGFLIEKKYPGIYYIGGNKFFDIQVIVSGELSREDSKWLRTLQDKLDMNDISQLITDMTQNNIPENRDSIQALLEVVASANEDTLLNWKEASGMGGALARLMEPELKDAETRGKNLGSFKESVSYIYRLYDMGFCYNDVVKLTGIDVNKCRFITNMYDIDHNNDYAFDEIDMTEYIKENEIDYDPVNESIVTGKNGSKLAGTVADGTFSGADLD